MRSIVQIQKKLVKIIAFKGRYEHEGPIFTELNFLTIEQIDVYTSCIYIYKAIQNNSNMFQIYVPIRYNTRLATSSTLVLSNAVATHSRQSIRWQGCVNWNKLPLELRAIPNYNSFKFKFKKNIYFLDGSVTISGLGAVICKRMLVRSSFVLILFVPNEVSKFISKY